MKPKYIKGDIVGVCRDAMYEFRITSWSEKYKRYIGRCLKSYTSTVKIGGLATFKNRKLL